MKRYLPPLAIFVWVTMLGVSMSAQSPVEVYTERLSKTTTASEIRKVLKAAEKDGLKTGDLLDLRYAAYLHTGKGIRDRTLERKQRNLLAGLSREFEDELPTQIERYLKELEKATPESREISRIAVRLAQILTHIPIFHESAKERAALAEDRANKAKDLYYKALQVESKIDPVSLETLALKVLLADEHMATGEIEKALPLYEQCLAGLEGKKGEHSITRVRALFNIAQIADLAGDVERLEKIKTELAGFGIGYRRTMLINSRTIGYAKGTIDPGGSIEFGNRALNSLLYNVPPEMIKPFRRELTIKKSDLLVFTPEVSTIWASGSFGHPTIVSVNADGNVTDVEVLSAEAPKDEIIKKVRKWKFRPLIYKGNRSPMKGLVYCWVVKEY